MGLLDRLKGPPRRRAGASLAEDARAMRATLDALRREREAARGGTWAPDLRDLVRDLLEGEVEAPTADVEALKSAGTDPDAFYADEVAPSWEGFGEAQRATRIDAFLEMCTMLQVPGLSDDLPPEMARSVRTRTLLLAWAFDETYGYLSSLARSGGPRA